MFLPHLFHCGMLIFENKQLIFERFSLSCQEECDQFTTTLFTKQPAFPHSHHAQEA